MSFNQMLRNRTMCMLLNPFLLLQVMRGFKEAQVENAELVNLGQLDTLGKGKEILYENYQ